jgi:hypothetical protein
MEYGTGALAARARPARPRLRQQIRARQYASGGPLDADPKTFVITDTAYDGDGRMINSRFLDGMTIAEGSVEAAGGLNARPGSSRRQVNHCRLRDWAFRGSAIGAAHPDHLLRGLRRSPVPVAPARRCRKTSRSIGRAIRSTAT